MTRKSALKIAKDYVGRANHCGWNGEGEPPEEFLEDNAFLGMDGNIYGGICWDTHVVDENGILEIQYDNDDIDEDREWYFSARYGLEVNDPNCSMETCFNLNDVNEIANTILEAQLEYEK